MPQFARPNRDINVGANWSTQPSGGNPLWQQLDDVTPDDSSSFIEAVLFVQTDEFEVGLSTVTNPGVHTGHILRMRSQDDSGSTGTIQVELKQGATVITTQFFGPGILTWTTDTYTLSSAEATAITDYSNLSVYATVTDSGANTFWDFTWIELEVPSIANISVAWLKA